ncbi:hypothetical protein Asp14428_24740 [Actinoplanes sp. NBRC 14428]|nr:hypothetical protein Asp14428_24740 [Actinoplanes sp. NBRC 14428]
MPVSGSVGCTGTGGGCAAANGDGGGSGGGENGERDAGSVPLATGDCPLATGVPPWRGPVSPLRCPFISTGGKPPWLVQRPLAGPPGRTSAGRLEPSATSFVSFVSEGCGRGAE